MRAAPRLHCRSLLTAAIRLHREIAQHGGGFLQYLDSKTMATHIIASTLPPKKTVDFGRYRIVKPAWIMDSVQAGKLLPWTDYRVLDEGPRQKVLKLDGGKSLTQSSPQARRGYREQSDNSFYTSQIKAQTSAIPSQGLSQMAEKLSTPGKPQALARTAHSPKAPRREHAAEEPDVPPAASRLDTESVSGLSGGETLSRERLLDPPLNAPEPPTDATPVCEPPKNMTSEQHNSWLLSDPRLRKSSTANPDFLKQYYSESRLHHLSTWKASLKASMQRLAADKGLSQKKPRKRPGTRRYVMHVDFDCFFCAVSLKRHPGFADKPTVVAHGPGPGSEIASCNYPARKFGVKNGMWMKRALELCPDLKVLPYDFPAYEEASRLFYESILSVGGAVQSVSVDEALIDASAVVLSMSGSQGLGVEEGSILREQERADEIARTLREQIKAKTGCAVSIGIGGNILQAKIALRKGKPAGQFQLKPEDVLDVIGGLKVEELPGVSYSIGGKLEELGIKYVKDIRDMSRERLASALGPKTGEKLADYSRGIDDTDVGEQPPRKSVSAEVNWGIRFLNQQEAEEFVYNLCKELEKRLLGEQVRGKHLTVKIMRRSLDAPLDPAKHLGHGKCDTFNKSAAFGVATHNYEVIGKEAVSILRSYRFSPGDLRGLGVQMAKLEPIKAYASAPEGSQRVLPFAAFTGPPSAKKQASRAEPIDDFESPRKQTSSDRREIGQDPIAEDPLTPRKPKFHPAMTLSRAGERDAKANTPLNVSGTQFIIPSNADPAVLAELPYDIRSRLMAQRPISSPTRPASRSESPFAAQVLPSQVDAEVFHALPEDMKAEVLATYGRKPAQPQPRQSPRKNQAGPSKKQTTPTKRGGIRGLVGKAQRQRDARAGVVQTNFKPIKRDGETPVDEDIEDLDPEFLAELPEDVRKEVVADHRRRRLARRSCLDAPGRQARTPEADGALPGGQGRIEFPAPPRKIPFASFGVTSTREVKDMLDAWHSESRQEGPHRGDVEVFEKYLAQVVIDEGNLEKVAVLVRWLNLLVEQDGGGEAGRESWRKAVAQVKDAVQEAVKHRGLAPLNI